MRTCFVSIPFGRKSLPDGREMDFDFLYREVIRRTVEEIGIECRRLDDYSSGVSWQKSLLTALISSDLVIADISANSPNVFYEIGLRHALKRGRTLLISAGGRIPSNLSYSYGRVLWYEADAAGQLTGTPADAFRQELKKNIEEGLRSPVSDSPIYEFFPELEVILPSELEVTSGRRRRRPRTTETAARFTQKLVDSPTEAKSDLEQLEAEVRATPESDPSEYIFLLRRYRDLSDWNGVIALAEKAPEAIAKSAEVRQMLVLALNRRKEPGDQDRAIALIQDQIAETGGDSETFGILGRIYKDRYNEARRSDNEREAANYLELALQSYREGFKKNPRDYYPGINVVNLLLQRDDEAARAELADLVPRVREAVRMKLETDRPDFWDLATDMQLAVVARDWARAEEAAIHARRLAPSPWMLETTVHDMNSMGERFSNPDDQKHLDDVLELFSPRASREGVANA